MSQVFHIEARVNFVTDGTHPWAKCFTERRDYFVTVGTHSWAKCFIDKLRFILLLIARMREPSVSQQGWGFVTDGTLMHAKRCILIMLLMAQ